jgi:hypothetical protein
VELEKGVTKVSLRGALRGSMQRSFAGSRRFRYTVIGQLPQKLSKNQKQKNRSFAEAAL